MLLLILTVFNEFNVLFYGFFFSQKLSWSIIKSADKIKYFYFPVNFN
jgi:hypothetical protein